MANQTAERAYSEREPTNQGAYKCSVAKIWKGSMAGVDASGYITPTVTTAQAIIGVATDTVDNSAGSAGDLLVPVKQGIFQFANSSTTGALTVADIGKPCYPADNQTVTRLNVNGTKPTVGIVEGFATNGEVQVRVTASQVNDMGIVDILLPAAADLSTTGAGLCAVINSSSKAALASADGQDCHGILVTGAVADAIVRLRLRGPVNAVITGTPAIGDRVQAKSDGTLKALVKAYTNTSDAGGATDALIGGIPVAIMLETGVNGASKRVYVSVTGAIPTTAA